MKNGNKIKKIIVLIVCIASVSVILGLGPYKPILRNANAPFIDLGGSIGNSLSYASEASSSSTAVTIPETAPIVVENNIPDPQVIVRVSECDISMIGDNGSYDSLDMDELIREMENGTFDDKIVILVDDYAEAKTFRKVIKLFNEILSIDPQIETRD